MTTTLLGTVAIPVLLGGSVLAFALRRVVRRRVLETPPGRVVIASNLADSRRKVRR